MNVERCFFTCTVCSALVAVYTAVLFTMLRTQLSVLITSLTQCGLVPYTYMVVHKKWQ